MNESAICFVAISLIEAFGDESVCELHRSTNSPAWKFSRIRVCVYSFTCSYGSMHVGRTTRHLSECIYAHHSACLITGTIKSLNSALVWHPTQTTHVLNVTDGFRAVFDVQGQYSILADCCALRIAEAILIRLHNGALCARKNLRLPFYSPGPSSIAVQIADIIIETRSSSSFELCMGYRQSLPVHIFNWLIQSLKIFLVYCYIIT